MAIDANGLFWWHSIPLPDGTVTPGEKTQDIQEAEWGDLHLPSLHGRTVLDVGAWDGWFSFRCESRGAARVVALDSFVWSLDFTRADDYWVYVRDCESRGERYDLWGPECAYWDSEALPGKRSFDQARRVLNSRVESVVADFMTHDLQSLGPVDIALFLGVLYHLREPLTALERLRSITGELAVIETAAIRLDGHEDASVVEFTPGYEVNSDPTNWFLPSEKALCGMCTAAGFGRVEVVGSDFESQHRPGITDYRLTVHARP